MFDLVTFIRRYAYYCEEADLMMVSLSHSTLTNHAFKAAQQAIAEGLPATRKLIAAPNARRLSSMIPPNADKHFQANSGFAWELGAAASAAQAAGLGVAAPTLRDRCVLSRLQRDLKAGEEIMEVSRLGWLETVQSHTTTV